MRVALREDKGCFGDIRTGELGSSKKERGVDVGHIYVRSNIQDPLLVIQKGGYDRG